jgi:addiction module RelE/StbE family toxin
MQIIFSKKFQKQYKKLSVKTQQQAKHRIQLWQSNPIDPILNLHRLKSEMSPYYSINITGDYRALYEVIDEVIYVFQLIGTHSELYK